MREMILREMRLAFRVYATAAVLGGLAGAIYALLFWVPPHQLP